MPAYDLMFPRIKTTYTGTTSQTIDLTENYQGIIVDNQNSSQIQYIIDDVTRITPPMAMRGLLFDGRFSQIEIIASGYYEIHLF